MSKSSIHIIGFPYFPGKAMGRLCKGNRGDIAKSILLISQHEIFSLRVVPEGIVVVDGAPFSHTMVRLLGLGVPAVLISTEQAALLEENKQVMIDGGRGLITDNFPTEKFSKDLSLNIKPGQAALMEEGEPVSFLASVRHALDASKAKSLGATAIGLVRSEFLLPDNGRIPDKAFYLHAFRGICEAAAPLTVTFRLLDVAADKIPPWLANVDGLGQALGLQGVRIFNNEPVQAVIEAQLAALSEISNDYSIRVLLPFLVRVEEFDYWASLIRPRLPSDVPVGAMAETPAMVLDICHLLNHADFIAIGCNDLMQSLFSADRDKAELSHYLDPYAPLLFRLFRQVAEEAGERLHHIQLCGVLAQIQNVLPVLLGLGYRSFSVDSPFIPYLANQISTVSKADCEMLASQVVAVETTQQVLELLQIETNRHVPFSS